MIPRQRGNAARVCCIEGCEKPMKRYAKRQLCEEHHSICDIDGCGRQKQPNHSLCAMHQARKFRHGDPQVVIPYTRTDPSERFWSKVKVGEPDECWIFGGTILSTGYGQLALPDGPRISAHRFAYEDKVGPIPEGLTIDHLCYVRACVNPAHLEPVTQWENTRRMHERQRGLRNG